MTEVVCVTCRKRFYCGYGSYKNYDERASRFDTLKAEHEGHELFDHSGDFNSVCGGDLRFDEQYGPGHVMAKDYATYEQIDLTRPPEEKP